MKIVLKSINRDKKTPSGQTTDEQVEFMKIQLPCSSTDGSEIKVKGGARHLGTAYLLQDISQQSRDK